MFFPLYHCQDFYRTWLYIWATRRVSYKKQELLTFASTWVHPRFLVGSVLLIFLAFCVVLLCVSTFWVPCCHVRYDFRIKTMFGSSLRPVVCRKAHVLFTLFVFVYAIVVSNTYYVVFLFCCSSSCIPNVTSFSGLFIFYCPFGIL